jgi:hypothetical protein
MTTTLDAIAFKSHTHPRHQFQNLYGLINSDLLYQSWGRMNKQSAPGADGVTAETFQERLPYHIQSLASHLKNKTYRAGNIKRVLIPKVNGKMMALKRYRFCVERVWVKWLKQRSQKQILNRHRVAALGDNKKPQDDRYA